MGKASTRRTRRTSGGDKKPKEKRKKKSREKKPSRKKTSKEKKRSKNSNPKEKFDDNSSSKSSSSSSTKSKSGTKPEDLKFVPVELPGLKQRPEILGLVDIKQSDQYLNNLLADERPDFVFAVKLTRTEADCLDKHLKSHAELSEGDEFMIENGNNYVKYEIKRKYNEGRYSAIYVVMRTVYKNNKLVENNQPCMMKTGLRKNSHRFPLLLKREYAVMKALNGGNNKKKRYCPPLIDYGRVCDMPFLVMGLLEKNLEKWRSEKNSFSLVTAFYIAKEALYALEDLHSRGYVYRDLKPTNLAYGVEKEMGRVFLLDYGDTVKSGKVIKLGVVDAFTLPYWSLDCHRRAKVTPKTDLESWTYMLIDLANEQKGLPWKKSLNTEEVAKAKEKFWKEYQTVVTDPTILQAVEAVAACSEAFSAKIYTQLSGLLTNAMQTQLAGAKFVPDWMKKK